MVMEFKWIQLSLGLIGAFGIFLGTLSFLLPERSIKLYQWLMRNFSWRVEPIDYKRELRNTRVLGLLLLIISGLMIAVLLKSQWVRMGGLRG